MSTETNEHPARVASQRSAAAVEAGDRDGWLALWDDDGIIEDPIGVSPLDPDGKGHRGRDAIAAFYDTVIAPNPVRFEVHKSYAVGDEVANIATITTTIAGHGKAIVDGVFCYRVNAEGKLVSLRAYWELAGLRFESE